MYDDEALIGEMLPILDLDHQCVPTVEGWNDHLVSWIRSCSGVAGRRPRPSRTRAPAADAS